MGTSDLKMCVCLSFHPTLTWAEGCFSSCFLQSHVHTIIYLYLYTSAGCVLADIFESHSKIFWAPMRVFFWNTFCCSRNTCTMDGWGIWVTSKMCDFNEDKRFILSEPFHTFSDQGRAVSSFSPLPASHSDFLYFFFKTRNKIKSLMAPARDDTHWFPARDCL